MTFLQIVLYILINAPRIISLIREIIALIKGMPHNERETLRARLVAAIEEHKKDKDDEKLGRQCIGIGCPSPLVSQ